VSRASSERGPGTAALVDDLVVRLDRLVVSGFFAVTLLAATRAYPNAILRPTRRER
jgi:hypothetical protein